MIMHKYTLGALLTVLIAVIVILIVVFTRTQPLDMTNPATVFCLDQGGTMKMQTQGNKTVGMCVLPGGDIECEQDAFFRGDCPVTAKYKYLRHECKPEEKNVDVCHDVYQVVCGYDSKGQYKEYSNGCFACKSKDILFWITGHCENK